MLPELPSTGFGNAVVFKYVHGDLPDGRFHKFCLNTFRIRTGKFGVGIKGIPPNTPPVLVVGRPETFSQRRGVGYQDQCKKTKAISNFGIKIGLCGFKCVFDGSWQS